MSEHETYKTLDELKYEDLLELKKAIKENKIEILINKQLEKFKNGNKVCPVCNTLIQEGDLTLFFGPIGLRKQATFCATDCLEYFLTKLKKEL
ncbi:MAG: hypothetical protein ABIC91_06275 [Nanoarchaeota archaeon]|nr:hypothetical protein [Nanoarchaeota archaeon]MBU1030380.1 hypothetical protein [Nanoarchaeota archaeon]MBU1850279.1 hypothetical protein [Nanoarchaeota archaeon]